MFAHINIEAVLAIHLSVLVTDESEALDLIRQAAKEAVEKYHSTARHLHIERFESLAFHTDLLAER